jgi:hypothetical protein
MICATRTQPDERPACERQPVRTRCRPLQGQLKRSLCPDRSLVCSAAITAVQKRAGSSSCGSRVSQTTDAAPSATAFAAHVLTRVVLPYPAGVMTTVSGWRNTSRSRSSSRWRVTNVAVGGGRKSLVARTRCMAFTIAPIRVDYHAV